MCWRKTVYDLLSACSYAGCNCRIRGPSSYWEMGSDPTCAEPGSTSFSLPPTWLLLAPPFPKYARELKPVGLVSTQVTTYLVGRAPSDRPDLKAIQHVGTCRILSTSPVALTPVPRRHTSELAYVVPVPSN